MTEVESLAHRLTRLEQQVWWWRAISALLIVGLGLLAGFGSAWVSTQAEVRARRFVVIGADGTERAALGIKRWSEAKDDKTDFVGLRLLDSKGKELAALGLRSEHEKAFLRMSRGEKDSLSLSAGGLIMSGDEGSAFLGASQLALRGREGDRTTAELSATATAIWLTGPQGIPATRALLTNDKLMLIRGIEPTWTTP